MVIRKLIKKSTITGINPTRKLKNAKTKVNHSFDSDGFDHKTHKMYDSFKHVAHNRNHTGKGVGRHS